jgi:hypothetical protein
MFIVYNYICDTTQTRVLSYYTVDLAYLTLPRGQRVDRDRVLPSIYCTSKNFFLNFSPGKAGIEDMGSF